MFARLWNPVRSLYERNDFRITSENEIHYFMERKPIGYAGRLGGDSEQS